jgi:hypothetical protein
MQKTIDTPETAVTASKPAARSLEERLDHKLKEAEWMLLLVIALMLWTAGFVDLATHRSRDAVIFGLYSLPYAALLVAYLAGFWAWGRLIFPRDSIPLFKEGIHRIQTNPWLGIATFVGAGVILGSMLVWDRWAIYPLLAGSFLIILIIGGAVILFARPVTTAAIHPWRKVTMWFFGVWVAAEVLLQLASLAGVLPFTNYSGLYTPYGRVYQQAEGFANSRTNKYGWYYPDLILAPNSRRIMVTGDSFVLGAQVKPEQNLGIGLQSLLNNADPTQPTEVLGLGVPGYGPGVYAEPRMIGYSITPFKPSELVVYFHLANDFQTATGTNQGVPFYQIQPDGSVNAHPDTHAIRHNTWHEVLRGYEPIKPFQTMLSHVLSVQFLVHSLLPQLNDTLPTPPLFALSSASVSAEQPFGRGSFAFATNTPPQAADSMAIAQAQLLAFQQELAKQGIRMRLVTIPYFPAAFYTNGSWDAAATGYDLLLPEQALKAFAAEHQIPFLGMGEYLLESQSPAAIQQFYLNNGTGHFSSTGHSLFAQATFDCFYTSKPTTSSACSRVTP